LFYTHAVQRLILGQYSDFSITMLRSFYCASLCWPAFWHASRFKRILTELSSLVCSLIPQKCRSENFGRDFQSDKNKKKALGRFSRRLNVFNVS